MGNGALLSGLLSGPRIVSCSDKDWCDWMTLVAEGHARVVSVSGDQWEIGITEAGLEGMARAGEQAPEELVAVW